MYKPFLLWASISNLCQISLRRVDTKAEEKGKTVHALKSSMLCKTQFLYFKNLEKNYWFSEKQAGKDQLISWGN